MVSLCFRSLVECILLAHGRRTTLTRHNVSVPQEGDVTKRKGTRGGEEWESLFGILLDAEKALVMSPPMANPAKY